MPTPSADPLPRPAGKVDYTITLDYTVTLECGCTIKTRTPPFTEHVRYGCTTGLRHGYRLRWTTYTGPNGPRANRTA